MIARELEELSAHYHELVESVTAGHLTLESAVESLDHIVATDASGLVWRLDLEGRFLCGLPGEQPQPADPERFQTRTSPGPWNEPWNPSSPVSMGATLPDYDRGPVMPSAPAASGHRTEQGRRARSFPAVGPLLAKLRNAGHWRTPLIVGVALLGAVLVWNNQSQAPVPGSTLPVETSSTVATVPGVDLAAVDALLAALADVNVDPSTVVLEPGEGGTLLLRRAQFAGYAAVGLTVKALGTDAANPELVLLELRTADGAVQVRGSVSIAVGETGPRLRAWPELGR